MGYSVTVNVELVGIPHTWIVLTDANGNAESFGYMPFAPFLPLGDGNVATGSNAGSLSDLELGLQTGHAYQVTYEVTQQQYEAMWNTAMAVFLEPGTYGVFGNNCTDFVREVLTDGGVNHPLGSGPNPLTLIPREERRGLEPPFPTGLPGLWDAEGWMSPFEQAESTSVHPAYSPLVLDLDGDGTESISVTAGAYFDHNGDGFADATGWVAPDDGLLVWDRDNDGRIENGRELFGTETILANGQKAANGFVALAEFDANADGKIDAADAIWTQLQIWKDVNGDGLSAAGEFLTLTQAGVQAINLAYSPGPGPDPAGNQVWQIGSFTRSDSTTGQVTDYLFAADPERTIAENLLPVSAAIAALPNILGNGTVHDLHQAIVRDTSGALQGLVSTLVSENRNQIRDALVEELLYRWTGTLAVDPLSRGENFDGRKLAVLEQFMGRPYDGVWGSIPVYFAQFPLSQAWTKLYESVRGQLAAQTDLKSLFDLVPYIWNEQAGQCPAFS